jgi:hypothetical protein
MKDENKFTIGFFVVIGLIIISISSCFHQDKIDKKQMIDQYITINLNTQNTISTLTTYSYIKYLGMVNGTFCIDTEGSHMAIPVYYSINTVQLTSNNVVYKVIKVTPENLMLRVVSIQ